MGPTIDMNHLKLKSQIDAEEHQRLLNQPMYLDLQFNQNDGVNQNLLANQPSNLSFLSHRSGNWGDDFISKVDQLKKQYIENQDRAKTDRNMKVSPDKKNFAELSNASIGKVQFNMQSPATNSLRKIVGNFNIQADLSSVQKVKEQPRHISKNIPHLNLPKKSHKNKLTFDEVN